MKTDSASSEGQTQDAAATFRDRIVAVLGNAPEFIEPGRLHRFSTSGRPGDDAGWCRLFNDMRGGVFGCWRQGINESWRVDGRPLTRAQRFQVSQDVAAAVVERHRGQQAQWSKAAKRNAEKWAQCVPVRKDDPVNRHLCRRLGVDTFVAPPCLRLHPALDYWHDGERIGTFPAMVAQFVAPDGRIVALHCTYLNDDGRKADVPTVRKLTRVSGPTAGASIRLASQRAGVLGVAEGIETALSASLASGKPVVAAYCTGALAAFQWPAAVRLLYVFADNDEAGRDAADKLHARARAAGLACEVRTPTNEGADWCDVWAQRDVGAPA